MLVAKFVRTGVAVVGAFLIASAAQAADAYNGGYGGEYGGYKDSPPPAAVPVPFWTGFYAGGNVGADWSNIAAADNVVFVVSNTTIQSNQSISSTGLFGGVQLGYNIQPGNFLWGVEADIGGMGIGRTSTFTFGNPLQSLTVASTGGWYGDITGRAGFVYGSALLYAKGGFAFFGGNVTVADPAAGLNQSSSTFTGWTVGAGLEYMLSPRWTVKAEYLYFDLGNNNCCFTSTSGRFDNTLTMSTAKIGFNFLLHSQVAPLY